MSWLRSGLLHAALLVAAVLALYGRTTVFGFSYVDDDRLIADNQAFLTGPGALREAFGRPYFGEHASDHAYFRPLVTVTFVLDAWRVGAHAGGYHATNVALHAVAVVALLLLLRALDFRGGTAFFGALAFAVHPALTESVAWIPGRTDLLAGLFSIGSLWCWVRAERGAGPAWRVVCLALWFCALLSKESALVLPFVFAAQRVLWQRRALSSLREPRLWLAITGVLAVYLGLRMRALSGTEGDGYSMVTVLSNLPTLIAGLGKLFLPLELAVLATVASTPIWPGLAALPLLYAAWKLEPERRSELGFGVVALGLALAPGLPASGVLLLESRLYFAGALFVIVVLEAFDLVINERSRPVVGIIVAVLLVTKSYPYTDDFRDRRSFAEAAVKKSPDLALAHRNLGIAKQLEGDVEGALASYELSLARDETEPVVHNNVAVILMSRGELEMAERHLRRELELNPDYAPARDNLTKILRATGRNSE